MNTGNFAEYIIKGCLKSPDTVAIRYPIMDGEQLVSVETATFADITKRVSSFQQGLKQQGFRPGDRILFVIKPSISMYCLILACIASGLVPVFVDMGMGFKKIKMAIEDSGAKAIFGVSKLLRLYWVLTPLRKMKRFNEGEAIPGCQSLETLSDSRGDERVDFISRAPSDHCLITFTSGSTGRPKGADRTHECLIEQHLAIKAQLEFLHDDTVLSCFPISVLHYLACGAGTVLPEVDFSRIGTPDAKRIIRQLEDHSITLIGTAPAFIDVVVKEYEKSERKNTKIRTVVIGGSTVSTELAKRCSGVFPSADIQIVYGSTEAEPISHIELRELLIEDSNKGFLVGKKVKECEVKIVRLPQKTQYVEADVFESEVAKGSVGEIIVSGNHVLQQYIDNPVTTSESKIQRENGLVWHRTGDYGFIDDVNNIWLTGRDKDLLQYNGQQIDNYPIEKRLDRIRGVSRAAILTCKKNIALVLEVSNNVSLSMKKEIEEIISPISIDDVNIFRTDKLPVDGRHNSKVDRPLLRLQIRDGDLTPDCGPDIENGQFYDNDQVGISRNKKLKVLGWALLFIFGVLSVTSDSLGDAISALLTALYIQIPIVIGGVLHMVVVSKDWFPQLKIPLNKRLFGENKTWRGAIIVPVLTLFGAYCLYPLEWIQALVSGGSVLEHVNLFWMGVVGGIGYILGELPNSMFKRKLGIAPGTTPKSYKSFFLALDQVDSAVGVALLYGLFMGFSFVTCIIYVITFPFVALLVKYYLHKFQLKDSAS